MATNAVQELMAEVNAAIARTNEAIAKANGAVATATTAADDASDAAAAADAAAQNAADAADAADAVTYSWENATVSVKTLAEGAAPTLTITESNGVKNLEFGIPRGATGRTGAPGPAGTSGCAFRLSGTTLYITTD